VYDPDLFADYATFGILPTGFPSVNLPRQKGPEFGGAIGGAILDGILSIGGVYRQANFEAYKLMKAGVLFQAALRTPFVHPVIRASFGYTKTFGGELFPATGSGIAALLVRVDGRSPLPNGRRHHRQPRDLRLSVRWGLRAYFSFRPGVRRIDRETSSVKLQIPSDHPAISE
jgi:hypothetical protein